MPLSAQEKRKLARQWVREVYLKPNATANQAVDAIEAAAEAIEEFITTNTVALNSAIPQPFRGIATVEQKRLLLALVAMHMAGILDLGD